MEVMGMGWQTDLALLAGSGSTVENHAAYVVVRTPDNPSFYWGNFLLLRRSPQPQDTATVLDLYARALPDAQHLAIGVDDPKADPEDLAALVEIGMDVESSHVLVTNAVHSPVHPIQATMRPINSDSDWAARLALSFEVHAGGSPDARHRAFVERRIAGQRLLVDSGRGVWLGAFIDGELTSSLGVIAATPQLARYQDVETHPAWRRHGLASALVHAAGVHALHVLHATTLVMVADPDYSAVRLYRSLGFVDAETQLRAQRSPLDV